MIQKLALVVCCLIVALQLVSAKSKDEELPGFDKFGAFAPYSGRHIRIRQVVTHDSHTYMCGHSTNSGGKSLLILIYDEFGDVIDEIESDLNGHATCNGLILSDDGKSLTVIATHNGTLKLSKRFGDDPVIPFEDAKEHNYTAHFSVQTSLGNPKFGVDQAGYLAQCPHGSASAVAVDHNGEIVTITGNMAGSCTFRYHLSTNTVDKDVADGLSLPWVMLFNMTPPATGDDKNELYVALKDRETKERSRVSYGVELLNNTRVVTFGTEYADHHSDDKKRSISKDDPKNFQENWFYSVYDVVDGELDRTNHTKVIANAITAVTCAGSITDAPSGAFLLSGYFGRKLGWEQFGHPHNFDNWVSAEGKEDIFVKLMDKYSFTLATLTGGTKNVITHIFTTVADGNEVVVAGQFQGKKLTLGELSASVEGDAPYALFIARAKFTKHKSTWNTEWTWLDAYSIETSEHGAITAMDITDHKMTIAGFQTITGDKVTGTYDALVAGRFGQSLAQAVPSGSPPSQPIPLAPGAGSSPSSPGSSSAPARVATPSPTTSTPAGVIPGDKSPEDASGSTMIVIVVLLVVIGGGIGGYFLYQKRQQGIGPEPNLHRFTKMEQQFGEP